MAKIKINIDGREITATAGMNIFEIAQENGIDIPHLCYDERMKPVWCLRSLCSGNRRHAEIGTFLRDCCNRRYGH